MWALGKLKLYAAVLIGVAVAVALKVASVMKLRQAKKELKEYVSTRKDIDEAQRNAADVDDDEWLRDRIDKRDL